MKNKIFEIRGCKVTLGFDLVVFYETSTKVLKQSVTRNSTRFLGDFMVKLTPPELENLSAQIVNSNTGGLR
jgi:hypothetical protein